MAFIWISIFTFFLQTLKVHTPTVFCDLKTGMQLMYFRLTFSETLNLISSAYFIIHLFISSTDI